MHIWDFEEKPQIKLSAKAKSVGAAGVSKARVTWLRLIKGAAGSVGSLRRARGEASTVDVELQEFLVLALRLAA